MALIANDMGHIYSEGKPYSRRALEGVDLSVSPGELVVVMGPSGSGKSTLIAACAGLLMPSKGRVRVDGIDPAGGDIAPGTVGVVLQDPETQLFGDTVLDDVSFGPRNLGREGDVLTEAVRTALEVVGLDVGEYGSRSPFGLSGGEARRVAIAGVLAMEPSYVLLDEPEAGLDRAGREAVHRIVERLVLDRGVVVVTHDPEEMLALADRCLVLAGGCSLYFGPPLELVNRSDVFEAAGLDIPGIVRVQELARDRSAIGSVRSLDPAEVAAILLRAAGYAS